MDSTNIGGHISRRYNEEMEDIRSKVLAMGGLVEQQIKDAIRALDDFDAGLAEEVVANDHKVNAMEVEIDEECNMVLVRRHPTAGDLRLVMAVIKTITDLERIGDEAERIASMVIRMSSEPYSVRLFTQIRNLGRHVARMVNGALDAFARLDVDKAVEVWSEDQSVDEEYESLMRELMTHMMEDPRSIPVVVRAMFTARAIERIGDRAGNICEYVIFLVKGKDVRHTRLGENSL